jgi:D-sedoheptulose 7-phosphate isomerase
MNREDMVVRQIEESMQLKESLQADAKTVVAIADQLVRALRRGNKVLLFGNGGSAADAQHIACELAGKFSRDREPLAAIALTTNTSSLTAIANDYGYDEVFARQLRGLVKKGDVVIGISTSGSSANVLLAIEEANRSGAVTIALTGQGGKLKELAHYVLSVPSTSTPRIQEAHITIGHIICHLVEEELFGQGGKVTPRQIPP